MKKQIQGYLAGLLTTALLAGGTAYASTGSKTIEVIYDNIKIFLDGEEIQPKDADGDIVEPFVYNGTTYLPVRAIGNAIGKDVSWDGVEKVVYLGSKPGSAESWLDVCGPYQYSYGDEYRLANNEYFTMSGKKYTNGFILEEFHGGPAGEALFNLDGKYDSLSFTVGHIDGERNVNAELNIYLDGLIAYTTDLKYDDVAKRITVPLDGANQMKIELASLSRSYNGFYGFSEGEFE